MKATEFLKRQHRDVEKLFRQALKSESNTERRQLVQEIAAQLRMHTMLEEQIFYPAFRDGVGTKKAEERVLEAFEEHHVVDLVMAELAKIDASAENYHARLTVLHELVRHHVEEEEEEMFPTAEKKLEKETLTSLAEQMTEGAKAFGSEDD
jgi:iron-sulfur cluster repair protein YtfE (RIC family)